MAKVHKKRFYEEVGWFGMVAILVGYFLVSFSFLDAHSLGYQLLTGIGSLGLVLHSYYKHDYQPLVLNLIWVVIAVIVIVLVVLDY